MSGDRLTMRQREDVALCAMTMAWCQGLRWDDLPLTSPADLPWEHDRESFLQTALVILGHRDIHARDYMGIRRTTAVRGRRLPVARDRIAGRGAHDPLSDRELADRLYAAESRVKHQEEALVWGETFLARHDAFLQSQTPQLAYAMKDAADGFRSALARLDSGAAEGDA